MVGGTTLTKTVYMYESKYGRITDGNWPKEAQEEVQALANYNKGVVPTKPYNRNKERSAPYQSHLLHLVTLYAHRGYSLDKIIRLVNKDPLLTFCHTRPVSKKVIVNRLVKNKLPYHA